jgi:hypothetical protein
MKSLTFLDISLLSTVERKARRIDFHPKSNLIVGMNHTGKSTLIKMLFETLGAYPSGKLEGWDKGIISCVTLLIDGVEYKVIRQGDSRALFTEGNHLESSASRIRGWSETFNALTGFNLVLSDKQEKTTGADPACFFLPFYINQDGSWGSKWNTFKGLARFKTPFRPIIEFFSQIVPAEYYRAKADRDGLQLRVAELDRERTLLQRAKLRISESRPKLGPKVSAAAFEIEINRLTNEVTTLNEKQETLRLFAVQQNEALNATEQEIRAAERALDDYEKDEQFIDRTGLEDLTCPVCGAKHTETFLSSLQYAEDARVLERTVLRLRTNSQRLKAEIERSSAERSELQSNYERLAELLETRRGDMKFGEVVESLGAENALSAFEAEEQTIENATSELLSKIHDRNLEMKSYVDKERGKDVRARFREHYKHARQLLNLESVDVSKLQVYTRPDLSGSGGPRAVLAYYAALWQICSPTGQASYVPPSIPLVIDCPNQQGQDVKNLPAIIAFISTKLPKESQVIVTFEGNVSEYFDKRIELAGERALLEENQFDTVSDNLTPLIALMQQDLLNK